MITQRCLVVNLHRLSNEPITVELRFLLLDNVPDHEFGECVTAGNA